MKGEAKGVKSFGGKFGRVSQTKLAGVLFRGDEANQRSLSQCSSLQKSMQNHGRLITNIYFLPGLLFVLLSPASRGMRIEESLLRLM